MPENAHVHDLLPALALGILDSEETSRAQEHLAGCLICRRELAAYESSTAELAHAAPSLAPSPQVKERLMARVQAVRPRRPAPVASRPWLERLLPAWGLASVILVIALGALNLLLWQRFNKMDAFLSPGGMRAVPLSPVEAASPATGFVLVSADGDEGALVVDGLPPLGEAQQYQLWLIRDGKRTSGAVFSTDENSYGGTRIRAPESLLSYSAVGITIEPAGGSPQPTGTQVLAGILPNP